MQYRKQPQGQTGRAAEGRCRIQKRTHDAAAKQNAIFHPLAKLHERRAAHSEVFKN